MSTRVIIINFILFLAYSGSAQDEVPVVDHFGGRIGFQFTIGQPVNRVGVVFNLYYQKNWFQINTEWQGYRNFSSHGPKGKSWESRTSIGLIAAIGKTSDEVNPFVDVLFHQTRRSYAAGYAYHFYKDNKQTSQGAGSIALHIKNFYLLTENDVLGSTVGKDNFRTGALAAGYRHDRLLYELMTVLWTGETRGKDTKTYRGEKAKDFPARWGYRDISNSLYGKYSHGILAANIQYALPYGQIAQAAFGVDDERIRNFMQNKMMHDMYFCPPNWTSVRNIHFPMLDCNGNPYCHQEDQEIRPTKLFWQAGVNGSRFY